jgi:salicylate 1-O-methyltransferase
MLMQGIIDQEKLNSFNIPNYYPSPSEVKLEVLNEGSFSVSRLEVSEVNWNALDNWDHFNDGYNVAQCIRAVAEPLLVSHFGEGVTEEVFNRFKKNATDHMPKEKTKVINITIVLTRKP